MFPIRGKRSRREQPSTNTANRPRGRPRKRHDQLATARKAAIRQYTLEAQSQSQSRPDGHAAPQLSQLESLPVELIHAIFFYALEINLPRASRRLCQVLSSPSIYRALTLLAYFDDDGEQPVDTQYFLPARYRVIPIDEKIALQTSILSCGWCSYEFVRTQLVTLRRLVSRQAWHRWRAVQTRNFAESLAVDQRVLPDMEDDESVEAYFFHDELSCLRKLAVEESSSGQNSTRGTVWTILAARVIPQHLLRGPWTGDRVGMIRMLHGGYSHLSYGRSMTVSASAVFEGMAAAIREAHAAALEVLTRIYKDFLLGDPSTRHENECPASADSTSLHHCMPVTLFHLATQQKASGTLLRLLLDAAIHDVPRDDDRLTSWALRASAQTDQDNASIATWLLNWMRSTSNSRIRQ